MVRNKCKFDSERGCALRKADRSQPGRFGLAACCGGTNTARSQRDKLTTGGHRFGPLDYPLADTGKTLGEAVVH